jgi:hypothetical protein
MASPITGQSPLCNICQPKNNRSHSCKPIAIRQQDSLRTAGSDSDSGIDTSRHGQLTGDGEKRKASAI